MWTEDPMKLAGETEILAETSLLTAALNSSSMPAPELTDGITAAAGLSVSPPEGKSEGAIALGRLRGAAERVVETTLTAWRPPCFASIEGVILTGR